VCPRPNSPLHRRPHYEVIFTTFPEDPKITTGLAILNAVLIQSSWMTLVQLDSIPDSV
jgi:hypothetical protein